MHVCLFDIDGTLIDTAGAGRDAMLAALAEAFQASSPADGVPFAGRTDRAITSDLFRLNSVEDNDANWERFVAAFVGLLPEHLRHRNGRVLPGVIDLLDALAAHPSIVLGLLTGNLLEGARLKLCHYRLVDYFTNHGVILGGFGDVHHHRDDVASEALAQARQACADAIDVRHVWVIGDTPRDVQCARAIGAKAVAVVTGVHSHADLANTRPDLLLPDLSDPSPLLESLGVA